MIKAEALVMLKRHKQNLTKQQYSTIRGQIFAGQPEAAMKGLQKLIKTRKEGDAT